MLKSSDFPQIATRPSYSFLNTKKIEDAIPKVNRKWSLALNELFVQYKQELESELFISE